MLVKAFALLEALSAANEPMPLAALAQQCGLAKPTAHRVLGDLARLGYVERVESGIYRLSGKFHHLAAGRESVLAAAAEPILGQLHHQTRETVNLGVLRRDRVVYLRVLESHHALRRVVEPGAVDPWYSTALGRAIVSQHDEAGWPRWLADVPSEGRTPRSVTEPEALRRILRRAQRAGYAEEVDENDIGVMCVAAPVYDGRGGAAPREAVAAVSVSAPSARVDRQRRGELAGAVVAAAAELNERISSVETIAV